MTTSESISSNINFHAMLNPTSSQTVTTSSNTPNSVVNDPKKEPKKKLTPEEEAYIISKGLDPNNLSSVELAECLNDFYSAKNTPAEDGQSQSAPVNTQTATSPVSSEQTPATSSTETAQQHTAVSDKTTTAVQTQTKSTEIKSDFKSAAFNQFSTYDPEGKVLDCDFEIEGVLTKEEQAGYFVKSLAKYEYAKSKWDSMTTEEQDAYIASLGHERSHYIIDGENVDEAFMLANILPKLGAKEWENLTPEEQAARVNGVEAKLAEEIPSWGKLQPQDKIILTRAFNVGAYSDLRQESLESGASFNEQLESVISKVIERRESLSDKFKQIKELDNNVLDYLKQTEGFTGDDLSMYKNGEETDIARFNYLNDKIQKNNGDISCLNETELQLYNDYKSLKDKGWDLHLGKYSQDKENSTFKKMSKDATFQEVYKGYISNNLVTLADEKEVYKEAATEAVYAYVKKDLGITIKDGKFYDVISGRELSREDVAKIGTAKFKEWLENCDAFYEKKLLFDVAYKLQEEYPEIGDIAKMYDYASAKTKAIAAGESKDAERELDVVLEMKEFKHPDHPQSLEIGKVAAHVLSRPDILGELQKTTIAKELLQIGSPEVGEAYFQASEKGTYSADEQSEVGTAVFENKDCEYSESTQVQFASNTHRMAKSIRREMHDKANATGNVNVIKAGIDNIHKHDADDQSYLFDSSHTASAKMPKEDAIYLETALADQVPLLHADNQLHAHETLMTSQYDEVLEYVTKNIVNYDSSVQAEALQMSIDTGNTKAIEAAASVASEIAANAEATNSSSSVQSDPALQQVIAQIEAKYNQQVVNAIVEAVIENNVDASNPDVANMSPEERRQYYSDKFNNVKDLSAFIDRLPDSTKKEAYIKIAMYCPNLLKTIAATHGSAILKIPGLPLQVINIVAIAMLNSGGEAKKEGAKFILKTNFFSANIEKVARETLYGEEKPEQTAQSGSEDSTATEQMYATMPQIISNRFMKSAFASNFNDINYRKFYKDMPPIKG